MKKKILCLFLALSITGVLTLPVYADRREELQKEKEATDTQLDDAYTKIDSLQEEKKALDAQINQLDKELVNVMVSLNVLEMDIKDKEERIHQVQESLKEAEEKRDEHYKKMKERIKYAYENPQDNTLIQALEGSISQGLSQKEYASQMYEFDQELLDQYQAEVEEVSALEARLVAEKAELEGMQTAQEEQQRNLEASLSEKRGSSENYQEELQTAREQADAYANLLAEQTQEISRLEEAARAEAVENQAVEAAREAARIAIDQEEAEAAARAAYNQAMAGTGMGQGAVQRDPYGNVIDGSSTAGYTNYVPYGTGKGQEVVNYALQFVGNPYVWGGTSLTNGADCSGFVQSVYRHFGVELPRVSQDQMYAGREVSYSQAQPGDLICYGDHIAIYMGGGQIVHASNSAPYPQGGIKVSDNAAYRTILSVRRVI